MRSLTSVLLIGALATLPNIAMADCVTLTIHNETLEDLTVLGVADYDNTDNAVGLTEWMSDGAWENFDFCLDASRIILVGVGGGKKFISPIYAMGSGDIFFDVSDRKDF